MGREATKQAQVRRLQDTLAIAGVSVVAFGAWTLTKTVIFFTLHDEETLRRVFEISNDLPMLVFYTTFAISTCVDLGMRLFIGVSARKESRGKRKGIAYLVVAGLVAASSAISIIFTVFGLSIQLLAYATVMTIFIEVTSIATLCLVIVCAIRLRRLVRLEE